MRGNAGFYRSYFHYKNVQVRISGPVCTLKKRVISNQKHAENEKKILKDLKIPEEVYSYERNLLKLSNPGTVCERSSV